MRGDGLVALAAALRLARMGHCVELVSSDRRWRRDAAHPLAAELSPVLELPSAWRDLFAKSGRSMDAELTGCGVELVEAPGQEHTMADATLNLPTERAAQLAAIRQTYGQAAAIRWRDLLDEADEVWRARRTLGLERPLTSRPRLRGLPAILRARPTLSGAAGGLPPLLAAALTDLGPTAGGTAKGSGAWLLAADLAVIRVFGRWQLLGPEGPTDLQPLLDLLDARAARLGIAVVTEPTVRPDVAIDTEAVTSWHRVLEHRTPYRAPTCTRIVEPSAGQRLEGIQERIVHTPDGPVTTWRWTHGDQLVTLSHDHTHPLPDPTRGPALSTVRAWARRPPLAWAERHRIPTLTAGAASHGGPEPWAQLLTGSLAAYRTHLALTGEDVSPTNRAVGADGRISAHRRGPTGARS